MLIFSVVAILLLVTVASLAATRIPASAFQRPSAHDACLHRTDHRVTQRTCETVLRRSQLYR